MWEVTGTRTRPFPAPGRTMCSWWTSTAYATIKIYLSRNKCGWVCCTLISVRLMKKTYIDIIKWNLSCSNSSNKNWSTPWSSSPAISGSWRSSHQNRFTTQPKSCKIYSRDSELFAASTCARWLERGRTTCKRSSRYSWAFFCSTYCTWTLSSLNFNPEVIKTC